VTSHQKISKESKLQLMYTSKIIAQVPKITLYSPYYIGLAQPPPWRRLVTPWPPSWQRRTLSRAWSCPWRPWRWPRCGATTDVARRGTWWGGCVENLQETLGCYPLFPKTGKISGICWVFFLFSQNHRLNIGILFIVDPFLDMLRETWGSIGIIVTYYRRSKSLLPSLIL